MNTFWIGVAIWEMYIFYYAGIPVNLASMLFSISKNNSTLSKVVVYLAVSLNLITVPFIMWSAVAQRDSVIGHPFPIFEVVLSLALLTLSALYLTRSISKSRKAKLESL